MAKNRFGTQLAAWRKAAGKTQEDLDVAIGKAKSAFFTAQIESGRIKPPEQTLCEAIAEALDVRPRTAVWATAAPVRLAAFGADLEAWHNAQMATSPDRLLGSERQLLDACRAAAALVGHDGYPIHLAMAEALERIMNPTPEMAETAEAAARYAGDDVELALRLEAEAHMWLVMLKVRKLAAAVKARDARRDPTTP